MFGKKLVFTVCSVILLITYTYILLWTPSEQTNMNTEFNLKIREIESQSNEDQTFQMIQNLDSCIQSYSKLSSECGQLNSQQ
jgi:hypothetical protein